VLGAGVLEKRPQFRDFLTELARVGQLLVVCIGKRREEQTNDWIGVSDCRLQLVAARRSPSPVMAMAATI
jgi:hypothetical protein